MAADQVRLGVVGLGRGFMLTLPALLREPAIAIRAAADPRLDARERFAREFAAPAFEGLDEFLADGGCDAVYIASPHPLHAAQAIAAAKAGLHVLVEKPMATSVADCDAMVAAARSAGTILMVGPSHGFNPAVREAERLIRARSLGTLRMVTALNFTDYVYRPRTPDELAPGKGGGVVWGQASHQIDVVRRLAASPVASVRAASGCWDAARAIDGAYAALLSFASGASASITYSGYAHYDSDELMDGLSELGAEKRSDAHQATRARLRAAADGEQAAKMERSFGALGSSGDQLPSPYEHFGLVIASCEKADLRLTPRGVWICSDSERRFSPPRDPTPGRSAILRAFAAAVRGEVQPHHDGAWSAETVRCCEAIRRSAASGREIAVRDL